MVSYIYESYSLNTLYSEAIVQTDIAVGRISELGFQSYNIDNGLFVVSGSTGPASAHSSRYRTGDTLSQLGSHSSSRTTGSLLLKMRLSGFNVVGDAYSVSPVYSKGSYIEEFISTEEQESQGLFPADGPVLSLGIWVVRKEVHQTFSVGVRVHGNLREMDKGWVRVNGELREIEMIEPTIGSELGGIVKPM